MIRVHSTSSVTASSRVLMRVTLGKRCREIKCALDATDPLLSCVDIQPSHGGLMRTVEAGVRARPATVGVEWHRVAFLSGLVCLAAVLVLNVPSVTDLRMYKSPAAVLSHLALGLIALGLSPSFPGWVARVAALSHRQRLACLALALAGPLIIMVAVILVAQPYGHRLFTREWGVVEPLQFVLWLTAAWLAIQIARRAGRGAADGPAFRLAAWACIVLALEEVDYLGVVSIVMKVTGSPSGRIAGHHIGGLHDVVNELGKTSLVLGLVAVALVAALIFAWALSRGLHRVVLREVLSPTALPLIGTLVFMGIGQLADMDHPILDRLLGSLCHDLCEEPMELLAIVCVNASLLAKLTARLRPGPSTDA
jgi:hypothetical protein